MVTVSKYTNSTETDLTSALWNDFNIKMVYPWTTKSREYHFREEIKKVWPSINEIWLTLVNQEGPSSTQLKPWKQFLDHYGVQYTLVVQFIQIIIATSRLLSA